MPARFFVLAHVLEKAPETRVAVGGKRSHPEFLGERERVAVVALGRRRGFAAGGDIAMTPDERCSSRNIPPPTRPMPPMP